jgi:hypothetical protein
VEQKLLLINLSQINFYKGKEMKAIKQTVLAVLLAAAIAPAFAAPIVLDHSPQALATGIATNNFSNTYGFQYFAQAFSLSDSTVLKGVDMYSASGFGEVGSPVKVTFWANNGTAPAAMLAQFSVGLTAIDSDGASGDNARKHADFDGFAAQAGTTYWLSVAGDGTELAQTAMNYSGSMPMRVMRSDGRSDYFADYQMPFRLYGEDVPVASDVPEPASLALFGLGMAGLASLRRKRQA